MPDFFLEIFSEEIPAGMQKNAAENFLKISTEILTKNHLVFDLSQIKAFITPRRLSLCIYQIDRFQVIPAMKKVGPKLGAEKKAVEGFLKSVGLSSESQLAKTDGYYVFEGAESKISSIEIIKNSLPQILQKMTNAWPKLMRWDVDCHAFPLENLKENAQEKLQAKWIRPIRNISCMFDDELIALDFAGLKSNRKTFGFGVDAIEINNATNYEEALKQNLVILNQETRRQKIIAQISKIIADHNLETTENLEKSYLVDQVVGLCENPIALIGNIDSKFLNLPDEVLILTLQNNQKYFCCKNSEGHLMPKFIFIANVNKNSDLKKITTDNEKLVKARLSDAEFFIHEDLKRPLISRLVDLQKVVFHQALGSLFEKIERLKKMSKFLFIFIPHCNFSLLERSADLCKADLTTKMVTELPELQGKIGSFYSHQQGEEGKVVAAVYEHYLPTGLSSELPKTSLGITLSIADKIDSIVGFYLANEKPTSSKDPYALRRAALGVIRISFQNNIALPIRILVEKSFNSYPSKLTKTLLEKEGTSFSEGKKLFIEEVVRFIIERLKACLKEQEMVRSDLVNVVINEYLSDLEAHKSVDILYLAKKIRFLEKLITAQEHKKLVGLYKRAANILAIEEKRDNKRYCGKPSSLRFDTKYEDVLYRRIKQISKEFNHLFSQAEFISAFKLLDVIEMPMEHFFDHVAINDDNPDLRINRLLLLSQVRAFFDELGDLSKIEIA